MVPMLTSRLEDPSRVDVLIIILDSTCKMSSLLTDLDKGPTALPDSLRRVGAICCNEFISQLLSYQCPALPSCGYGEGWLRSVPEGAARQNIDKQLTACGWTIQDMSRLNRYTSLGVAVREFPATDGEAVIKRP